VKVLVTVERSRMLLTLLAGTESVVDSWLWSSDDETHDYSPHWQFLI
jgi:hypothetical protein